MLASWLGAALLLPHVVAFPVPHESSTCVGYLSTFLLSWSGAVSGASVSIVRKLVYLAATLLAALGGFARGLGPSRGLARVGLAFLWFQFITGCSTLYLVSLVRGMQTGAASGFEHQEEKKQIWKVEDAECVFWWRWRRQLHLKQAKTTWTARQQQAAVRLSLGWVQRS